VEADRRPRHRPTAHCGRPPSTTKLDDGWLTRGRSNSRLKAALTVDQSPRPGLRMVNDAPGPRVFPAAMIPGPRAAAVAHTGRFADRGTLHDAADRGDKTGNDVRRCSLNDGHTDRRTVGIRRRKNEAPSTPVVCPLSVRPSFPRSTQSWHPRGPGASGCGYSSLGHACVAWFAVSAGGGGQQERRPSTHRSGGRCRS